MSVNGKVLSGFYETNHSEVLTAAGGVSAARAALQSKFRNSMDRILRHLLITLVVLTAVAIFGCDDGYIDELAKDPGLGGTTPVDYGHRVWNFLVYINGDSGSSDPLDRCALGVMKEMEKVGSTETVRVLVFVDRAEGKAWSTTRLYYVTRDLDPTRIGSTLIADYDEKDMSAPATLRDFISDCQREFPADHTILSIYAHGGGVWPRSLGARNSETKGLAWDHTTGTGPWNCLTTDEVAAAFSEARAESGQKIDVVYLDSCNMQMMEVAYEWKDEMDYLVGSQEDTHGVDFVSSDYERMLLDLNAIAVGGGTTREYALSLVDTSHDLSVARAERDDDVHLRDTTVSAVEMAGMDSVFSAFREFASRLNGVSDLSIVREAFRNTTEFCQNLPGFHELHDLYDFVDEISRTTVDGELVTAANDLKAALGDAVIAHEETGVFDAESPAYGLSILLPTRSEWVDCGYGVGYRTLRLSRDSEWDEFILRLAGVDS